MFCANCGSRVPDGEAQCPQCRAALKKPAAKAGRHAKKPRQDEDDCSEEWKPKERSFIERIGSAIWVAVVAGFFGVIIAYRMIGKGGSVVVAVVVGIVVGAIFALDIMD